MSGIYGIACYSMAWEYGIGMSAPATLSSGASRWSNASLSINKAAISAPTPCYGHPSSTFTILFVFFTESITACLSRGLIDLRLMTSALIPWSAYKISAALREWPTILENAVMVTSVPSLSTLAFPRGRRKFGSTSLSGTSNSTPYIISHSRNTTGSGSLIADLSKPKLSVQFHGVTTFNPGTEPYQAAKHYECYAATPALTPLIPLKTIGQVKSPFDI